MFDEKYKVDHLFLLVGTNPLPNYVAAKLLWRKSEDHGKSKIYLVYSAGTDTARQSLQATLETEYQEACVENVKVDEANPDNISKEISGFARNLNGKVGLNYTGGRKVMAVHAYLALKRLTSLDIQYSYLDARTLRMIIQGTRIEKVADPQVGVEVEPSVETILALHSYAKPSLKREPIWPDVANKLAHVHSQAHTQQIWISWLRRSFFSEPTWPALDNATLDERDEFWKKWVRDVLLYHVPQPVSRYNPRKWKNKTALKQTSLDLPSEPQSIADTQASILSATGSNPCTLGDVQQAIGFKDAENVGKWFEGEWLETYVLSQLQQLKAEDQAGTRRYKIGDIVRDIQAKRQVTLSDARNIEATQELQLDVAFLRGYQLFVLSCTTDLDKPLCKSKLLEAAVRAEQIGGAEARVGLVCCFEDASALEKEIADVLGKRVRIFCRSDLLKLKDHIADWIDSVSR